MDKQRIEKVELDELRKELEISELEDRLEMVNAAAASAGRCSTTNDGCTVNQGCSAEPTTKPAE